MIVLIQVVNPYYVLSIFQFTYCQQTLYHHGFKYQFQIYQFIILENVSLINIFAC